MSIGGARPPWPYLGADPEHVKRLRATGLDAVDVNP